ncbi:MAG: type II toxin-antitoxin system RelE/ParE family toxin [Gallionellaceae bacterium]|nr:type II toxin-antitoxin system RelE/ParE family toxin [Gallionellaceae bacterium]
MKLRYTVRARHDLTEIHDYVAQANPQAAKRLVSIIRKEAGILLHNPLLGRIGRVEGTRELTVGRYPFMIAYRIEAGEIHILTVVHTARLWPENL